MPVGRLFRSLAISASGLSAQRMRIETIAQNIANAQTTRTPQGGPYRRQIVELEAVVDTTPRSEFGEYLHQQHALRASQTGESPAALPDAEVPEEGAGVRVVGVVEDPTEGPLVYDPGHPDADEYGYVRMPNVAVNLEMADLMIARRVYEANATVFEVAKAILRRSIEI